MSFILGCNYWASHAGTEMWKNWNADVVRRDLELLSENGIEYLRVFPNWRDFQPVKPLYCGGGTFYEYRMENESFPENPFYLDEEMLQRFHEFCQIAEQLGMKLIVGLLTGWMSGRLFIPSALFDKNIYTDPAALSFEQKFIKGFISRMKDEAAIYAWDLGNECNCMGKAQNRIEAENWTAIIANAIRAADPERLIVSGMHSLSPDSVWSIQDQAMHTDILTTHPYPFWVPHCSDDKMQSMKTMLHAVSESRMYASIGHKPCLVEEIGTMGPMICDEQTGADFIRVNLWANWADGQLGVMWWCAHDQNELETAPYSWNMCERELGLLDSSMQPKPVLKEMNRFAEFLRQNPDPLPAPRRDAVCILTKGIDHWGIAYISYVLAKQAGFQLTFCYAGDEIPAADFYLLPSIQGHLVMPKSAYDTLKQRVQEGAVLWISHDGGFLTEFSELTGLTVVDSEQNPETRSFVWNGENLPFTWQHARYLRSTTADVLGKDQAGEVCFARNSFGKGIVYYLNFPLEAMLLKNSKLLEKPYFSLYQTAASQTVHPVAVSQNPNLCITEHMGNGRRFIVAINYTKNTLTDSIHLDSNYQIVNVVYGSEHTVEPFDACVWEVQERK